MNAKMRRILSFRVAAFGILLLRLSGNANAADFNADCEFPFSIRVPDLLVPQTEYLESMKQFVRATIAKRTADHFSSGAAVFPFYPRDAEISYFSSFRKDSFFFQAIVFRVQAVPDSLVTLQKELANNAEKGRELGGW